MEILKSKWFWIVIVILFVIGLFTNNDTKPVSTIEDEPKQEQKEHEKVVETVKTEITYDEFNQKFTQDQEQAQYPNGKFELKDGTIVNADYLMYGENELFYDAITIFNDGKLAKIQMETDKTEEEIQKALGISLKGALMEPYQFGYEIVFDDMFHDDNIRVFPNEWE